jgi:hypothetical protein
VPSLVAHVAEDFSKIADVQYVAGRYVMMVPFAHVTIVFLQTLTGSNKSVAKFDQDSSLFARFLPKGIARLRILLPSTGCIPKTDLVYHYDIKACRPGDLWFGCYEPPTRKRCLLSWLRSLPASVLRTARSS